MDPEASDTSAEGTATGLSGSRTDASGSHSSPSGPGFIMKKGRRFGDPSRMDPATSSRVRLTSYCDPAAGADVRLLAVAFVFLPQKSGSCLTHSGSG
jgi:hypothetical protein